MSKQTFSIDLVLTDKNMKQYSYQTGCQEVLVEAGMEVAIAEAMAYLRDEHKLVNDGVACLSIIVYRNTD